MSVTEVVAGSLQDEVQVVTLRAEGNATGGSFRLEVGTGSRDEMGWDRITSEYDDRFWTSELGVNSTAEEVSALPSSSVDPVLACVWKRLTPCRILLALLGRTNDSRSESG